MNRKQRRKKAQNRRHAKGEVRKTLRNVDQAAEVERLQAALASVAPWAVERNAEVEDILNGTGSMLSEGRNLLDLALRMGRDFDSCYQSLRDILKRLESNVTAARGNLLQLPEPDEDAAASTVAALQHKLDQANARILQLSREASQEHKAPKWAGRIVRRPLGKVKFTEQNLVDPSKMNNETTAAVYNAGLRVLRDAWMAGGGVLRASSNVAVSEADKTAGVEPVNPNPQGPGTEPLEPTELTSAEAIAKHLGFSSKTLRRRINNKDIDCIKVTGSGASTKYHATVADLDEWLRTKDMPKCADCGKPLEDGEGDEDGFCSDCAAMRKPGGY